MKFNFINTFLLFTQIVNALYLRREPTCSLGENCYMLRLQNYHDCGLPGFNLHGLWYEMSQWCTKEPFNITQVETLIPDMLLYWPSCVGNKTFEDDKHFWNHEWERHGTCTGMSQYDFFSTTLNLAKDYRDCCVGPDNGTICSFCFDDNLDETETCINKDIQ